jgi:hypothetical protein
MVETMQTRRQGDIFFGPDSCRPQSRTPHLTVVATQGFVNIFKALRNFIADEPFSEMGQKLLIAQPPRCPKSPKVSQPSMRFASAPTQ